MSKRDYLYHIFEVNDYKGGELKSSVNCDYDEFIENISLYTFYNPIERFDYLKFESTETLEDYRNAVQKVYERDDFQCTYPSGAMFCGEIYKTNHVSGEMIRLQKENGRTKFDDFLDDIAEFLYNSEQQNF
jgi:hypothetical protein